jgi:hypothetical protein
MKIKFKCIKQLRFEMMSSSPDLLEFSLFFGIFFNFVYIFLKLETIKLTNFEFGLPESAKFEKSATFVNRGQISNLCSYVLRIPCQQFSSTSTFPFCPGQFMHVPGWHTPTRSFELAHTLRLRCHLPGTHKASEAQTKSHFFFSTAWYSEASLAKV